MVDTWSTLPPTHLANASQIMPSPAPTARQNLSLFSTEPGLTTPDAREKFSFKGYGYVPEPRAQRQKFEQTLHHEFSAIDFGSSSAPLQWAVRPPKKNPAMKAYRDTLMGAPLSEAEVHAVERYVGISYFQINRRLRENDALDPKLLRPIYISLNAAIFKSRTQETMRVFRGFLTHGLKTTDLHPGSIFIDRGFQSTSRSLNVATGIALNQGRYNAAKEDAIQAVIFDILIRPGFYALDLSKVSSVCIDGSEREILLPANTAMRIRSVAQGVGVAWVRADVIGQ